MAVALLFLLLLLLLLAALSTLAPWPFETFALVVGLTAACLTGIATHNAFLTVCAAAIPFLTLILAKTMRQTLDDVATVRRRARRRRASTRSDSRSLFEANVGP